MKVSTCQEVLHPDDAIRRFLDDRHAELTNDMCVTLAWWNSARVIRIADTLRIIQQVTLRNAIIARLFGEIFEFTEYLP